MEESLFKFRSFVKEQMGLQKITRTGMACELGLHRSQVTRILDYDGNLTFKTMHKVAKVLGYSIEIKFIKEDD